MLQKALTGDSELYKKFKVKKMKKYKEDGIYEGHLAKICFLNDTRLKFRIGNGIDAENNKGISIACAMIYWGKDDYGFEKVFSKYGNIR